jgi:RNA recognition motif-containing protein
VTRVKIPMDENGDYRGLAFATFKKAEDCTKVID